jgi:hypothetical protein
VLPAYTIVVGFVGSLDGTSASYGERGTWSYVVAGRGIAGWAAGALLEPYTDCLPTPAMLAQAHGSGSGPFAAEPLIVRDRILVDGRGQLVFVAVARDAQTRESFVGVFPTTSSCRLQSPTAVVRRRGYIELVILFELQRPGGPTALALGVREGWTPRDDGTLAWTVQRVGDNEQLFSRSLTNSPMGNGRGGQIRFGTSQRHGRGPRQYFAIAISNRGGDELYAYDGQRIIRAAD